MTQKQLFAESSGGVARNQKPFPLGQKRLTIKDTYDVGVCRNEVRFSPDPETLSRLNDSVHLVDEVFSREDVVYGINTNFGGHAIGSIPESEVIELQHHLIWGLKCAVGEDLEAKYVRAAMLVRANALAKGVSGVRPELIERLITFINMGVSPRVKSIGSIGASGDLIPLAYIAGAIIGLGPEFEVEYRGENQSSTSILEKIGLRPMQLRPKEGLALVNGTSVLSAIAAITSFEFNRTLGLSLSINALYCQALTATIEPFSAFLHQQKPHPGQIVAAETMFELLRGSCAIHEARFARDQLQQDRYSIRCIPQYYGPLIEGMETIAGQIETEINAADDNPLADCASGRFVQGGNFFAQHIAMAMDQIRQYIALAAKQLDVQIGLIVAPEFSRGLSPSLSVGSDEVLFGLKGLQIFGNSIIPKLIHQAAPISLHYQTHAEQFNQNINSQGFNSSVLAAESMGLFYRYLSVALIFGIQAVEVRSFLQDDTYDASAMLSHASRELYRIVYDICGQKPEPSRPLIVTGERIAIDSLLERIIEDMNAPSSRIFSTNLI